MLPKLIYLFTSFGLLNLSPLNCIAQDSFFSVTVLNAETNEPLDLYRLIVLTADGDSLMHKVIRSAEPVQIDLPDTTVYCVTIIPGKKYLRETQCMKEGQNELVFKLKTLPNCLPPINPIAFNKNVYELDSISLQQIKEVCMLLKQFPDFKAHMLVQYLSNEKRTTERKRMSAILNAFELNGINKNRLYPKFKVIKDGAYTETRIRIIN